MPIDPEFDPQRTRDISSLAGTQSFTDCTAEYQATTTQPQANGLAGALEVPGHVVLGEIAHGGMGRVLAGRELALDREVAIKVLLPGADTSRFVSESKITAQLPHPNIPPVYSLGTLAGGAPFLTMKLVRGRTLAELLKKRASPQEELPRFIQVVEQIAQAVGFAHAQGIIHRDLKPANVMVGEFGEVQVMDWGLAKSIAGVDVACNEIGTVATEPLDGQTLAGTVLGTPAYMAPEQARGETVDERADVFSLGAILLAVLVNRPPFSRKTLVDTIRQAATADLTEAYTLLDACMADTELVAVAKKCLAAHARDRYANGLAVAEAIAAYRAGVETRLRIAEMERATTLAKAAEQRKRRRVQFALAGAVLLAFLGAGVVWAYISYDRSQRRTETATVVASSVAKAEQLRNRAQAVSVSAIDLSAAETALQFWDQSQAAIEQAETAIAGGISDPTQREQVQNLASEIVTGRTAANTAVERARKATRLLAALKEARRVGGLRHGSDWNAAGGALAYQQALNDSGIDVLGAEQSHTVAAIQELPKETHPDIIAALDQWLDFDPNQLKQIVPIAQAIDNDPWMQRYRNARLKEDREALKQLAIDVAGKDLPAVTLNSIGNHVMRHVDGPLGVRVMRLAQIRHPNDFWINNNLGIFLALYATDRGIKPNREEWVACLRAASAINPDAVWTRSHLAERLWDTQDHDVVIAEMERLLEIDPNNAFGWARMAYLLALGKRPTVDVVQTARRALQPPPDDPRTYVNVIHALTIVGHTDSALEITHEWKRRFPNDPTSHASTGWILYQKKDFSAAVVSYREAVRLAPNSAYHRNMYSVVLLRNKDIIEGIAQCRESLRIDANFANAHANLAYGLVESGDAKAALTESEKAVELAPNYSWGHHVRGRARCAMGDLAGAIESYEEALRLDPSHDETCEKLDEALRMKTERDSK